MEKLPSLGRYFFAAAMVASGIQQLILADFVRLVPKLPAWIPWPSFWACFTGLILIVMGAAIAAQKKVRLAAVSTGILLLLLLVFLYVPQIASNPKAGFMWTNPSKTLALLSGAILLAGIAPGTGPAAPADELSSPRKATTRLALLAAWFFGVFLFICGVQHFIYAEFVDSLVPGWILPGRRFWTYFSGTALIAGGAGLILPKLARLAAILSGVMIFLWVVLLHIPRALADLHNAGETSAIFEALALSGVAFLVAGTLLKPTQTG